MRSSETADTGLLESRKDLFQARYFHNATFRQKLAYLHSGPKANRELSLIASAAAVASDSDRLRLRTRELKAKNHRNIIRTACSEVKHKESAAQLFHSNPAGKRRRIPTFYTRSDERLGVNAVNLGRGQDGYSCNDRRSAWSEQELKARSRLCAGHFGLDG